MDFVLGQLSGPMGCVLGVDQLVSTLLGLHLIPQQGQAAPVPSLEARLSLEICRKRSPVPTGEGATS